MSDYIKELNDSQREAVLYNDGPSLVIAGAGSGKTRVLTYKIAYLIDNGIKPWNILALTFTNKAAREMKERIGKQVQNRDYHAIWMGTFHSIFLRILHNESHVIGFTSNFTVYDQQDSKNLIKSIIKELKLDDKLYRPGTVQNHISNAKNRLVLPSQYAASKELNLADFRAGMPRLGDIYEKYWNRLKQADAMDFDDLLFYTFLLFKNNPQVLAKYQDQFQNILVDEYQDTNYAQHCIVVLLAQKHHRICVVGDDAQSIYSFRGAEIDNILHFKDVFPETKIFKLEQNYRSTQTIVRAANSLIKNNKDQIYKEVFSKNEEGEQLFVAQTSSDTDEAEWITNKIENLHRNLHLPFDSFAILYRTNAQSRVFEETLRRRRIPYRIYGGQSFYARKEIKDSIAYFRMVVNPHDEEAFKRIINYPSRGIGETTLNKIVSAANLAQTSLWNVIKDPTTFGLEVNKGTMNKINGFVDLIQNFIDQLNDKNAYQLGTEIITQSGIVNEVLTDDSPEAMSRKENIEELGTALNNFYIDHQEQGNTNIYLNDFLSEVSLLTDQDTDDSSSAEKVTAMTVHAAKGLEFDTVFIAGLEENLFPSEMSGDSPRALEEERRLFYVALTRAKARCFLSYARNRFRYGRLEFGSPSRFLKDISSHYLCGDINMSVERRQQSDASTWLGNLSGISLSTPRASSFATENKWSQPTNQKKELYPRLPSQDQRKLKPVDKVTSGHAPTTSDLTIPELKVGDTIQHERFGLGQVIDMEGSGLSAKATIHFQNAGNKQLLLRFAHFKVVK